jgi:transaldolase
MALNKKLAELSGAGVAVWLDDLSRDRIRSGDLQSLVDDYSVVGVTTNPTIFAAAISASDSYDDQVHAMAVRKVSVGEALRTITAADVRDACDLLAPVAQRTGRDGRVSLEVAPGVARDTDATAAEAAHLWWLVDRPNLFIKIPATQEGLAAITTSIARGISINVTLIFSPARSPAAPRGRDQAGSHRAARHHDGTRHHRTRLQGRCRLDRREGRAAQVQWPYPVPLAAE